MLAVKFSRVSLAKVVSGFAPRLPSTISCPAIGLHRRSDLRVVKDCRCGGEPRIGEIYGVKGAKVVIPVIMCLRHMDRGYGNFSVQTGFAGSVQHQFGKPPNTV